jgi:hypothetical protein
MPYWSYWSFGRLIEDAVQVQRNDIFDSPLAPAGEENHRRGERRALDIIVKRSSEKYDRSGEKYRNVSYS